MDKKTIYQLIATGVGVISLFIIMANNLKSAKKQATVSKAAVVKEESLGIVASLPAVSPIGGQVAEPTVVANPEDIEEQKKRAMLDWGTDPFYHIAKPDEYRGIRLIIKGISIGKDGKGYAFINNEIVSVGDVISGYTVKKVQKKQVLLQREEEIFYLALPEEEQKE